MTHQFAALDTPVAALDRCIRLMLRGTPHPDDRDIWHTTRREASIIADRHDAQPVKSIWATIAGWAAILAALIALGLWASPALAEGGCWDDCGSVEEPDDPPPAVTVTTTDGDSAYQTAARIYFATCTCTRFRTAWGLEPLAVREEAARTQCLQRRARLQCDVSSDSAYTGSLK
jgi:hypothetical protein